MFVLFSSTTVFPWPEIRGVDEELYNDETLEGKFSPQNLKLLLLIVFDLERSIRALAVLKETSQIG